MVDYFNNLTRSIATARHLLHKANEQKAAIEGLCLYISIIDGFLRLAIIYSGVQKSPTHTLEINKGMLHQDEGEKGISEREIFRMALGGGIISEDLHKKLSEIYTFRNKVIHRFSTSTVTYPEIQEACDRLEVIYKEIYEIVEVLENGPHGPKSLDPVERMSIENDIRKKAGPGLFP